MKSSPLQRYESLRDQGVALMRAGDLPPASELLEQALAAARSLGDRNVEDRAFCNWVGVTLSLRPCDAQLPELREILVRNSDAENCRLAAYHLAWAYEKKKEYKKGLFYARIALERTRNLETANPEWLVTSHNQLGNLLVAESFFADGLGHYETALECHPQVPEMLRAMIVQNVGYCHLMLGEAKKALGLLYQSLRTLRGHRVMAIQAHLDVSLALLEVDKHHHAARHAARALCAAEAEDRQDDVKNALYLLGEAYNLLGDEDAARSHFSKLQRYFPETPFLTDFLLATDIRQMVNLRA